MVAGEASGDMHGADLAAQILARDPSCDLFGIAGQRMRTAGVRALYNMEDLVGFGVTELTTTIRQSIGALRALVRMVKRQPPDLAILIDFAEFNLIFSRTAKRAGVPVLYYITPQVWAWRRGRVRKIIERTDRMAVVFPFEADLYAKAGSRVTFVGHPLLDRVHPAQPRKETLARHQLPPASRLITILPGSRRSEIGFLLQPMVEAARVMARDHGFVPCLALAPTLGESDLKAVYGADLDDIRIIKEDSYSVVAASEVALVASGTATLETALLECPMVIAYKLKPISYLVAWTLVTGVKNIGMPNILAGRTIVPELIQSQVTASNLVRAAEDLLIESNRRKMVDELKTLRTALGAPGAPARVAQIALDMIHD
ncbi:MAG TPA: lipid-A-disaccharide synthase [Candidatus Binataceae bacterium]|jgi:lipid-A-disaccharide synthase